MSFRIIPFPFYGGFEILNCPERPSRLETLKLSLSHISLLHALPCLSPSLPLSAVRGGIMMRRTFKSDFGTSLPLLASQCRHPLLLLATNTIDAAGSPDCLGPGFHCLSRLFNRVYVQEVTFCFWLSCAFFCSLSFFISLPAAIQPFGSIV